MTTVSPRYALTQENVQRAAQLIEEAQALLITAGAGMGVDSGLPDFRGNEGFWRAYPALGKQGMSFADIASPHSFHANPKQAWGFYGHRLQMYRAVQPHVGFAVLKRWAQAMPGGAGIYTSNVDGAFQKAGFAQAPLKECHGSLHVLQCLKPCHAGTWSAQDFEPVVDSQRCELLNDLPRCPRCGGLARPNVLMFSDSEWLEERTEAQALRLERWLQQAGQSGKLVVVELGAGTTISTVRHFAARVQRDHAARLVRINVREPKVSTPLDVGMAAGALEALTAINEELNKRRFGARGGE